MFSLPFYGLINYLCFKGNRTVKKNQCYIYICSHTHTHILIYAYICYCDGKNPTKTSLLFPFWSIHQLRPFYTLKFLTSTLVCCPHKMEAQCHSKYFSVEYGFFFLLDNLTSFILVLLYYWWENFCVIFQFLISETK